MLRAGIQKYTLQFKQASGTSRGVLHAKNSWIITLLDDAAPELIGTGEASIIENLSPEWNEQYETKLQTICQNVTHYADNDLNQLREFPSIRFALEAALLDLKNGGRQVYFPSAFTQGQAAIPINGLIWMGSKEFMEKQIREKIEQGYSCIKLKIGAIDFETELDLLKSIRSKFSKQEMELRVDANGAFSIQDAQKKLEQLARLDLHSIEQPIQQGQLDAIQKLCASTPLPIALDEELIGVNELQKKSALLTFIKPQYIILKPSLVGGFQSSDEWISLAEKNKIGWWITSALESNIGLNAIAQYTFTKHNPMPQGLGTGQLYTNNFPSGLTIENGRLSLSL